MLAYALGKTGPRMTHKVVACCISHGLAISPGQQSMRYTIAHLEQALSDSSRLVVMPNVHIPAQQSTQDSTGQHSTAQHSTAQHSTGTLPSDSSRMSNTRMN